MESKKDIYYQGRIYSGCERPMPRAMKPKTYRQRHTMSDLDFALQAEHAIKWEQYLSTLTSYEVIGSHSWKDGQEVTGLYELQEQEDYVRGIGRTSYPTFKTFAVAIPLQQPVPQAEIPTGKTKPFIIANVREVMDGDYSDSKKVELLNEIAYRFYKQVVSEGKNAEEILDRHYKKGMHWKTVNRANVLAAMEEYKNQPETKDDNWISVRDRLPTREDADENRKVLIYRKMNEGQKGLSKSVFDWSMVKNCELDSYWQPLPAPPKD